MSFQKPTEKQLDDLLFAEVMLRNMKLKLAAEIVRRYRESWQKVAVKPSEVSE